MKQEKLKMTLPIISYFSSFIVLVITIVWQIVLFLPFMKDIANKNEAYIEAALKNFIQASAIYIAFISILGIILLVIKIIVIIQAAKLEKKHVFALYILGFFVPFCTTAGFITHLIEINDYNKKIDIENQNY